MPDPDGAEEPSRAHARRLDNYGLISGGEPHVSPVDWCTRRHRLDPITGRSVGPCAVCDVCVQRRRDEAERRRRRAWSIIRDGLLDSPPDTTWAATVTFLEPVSPSEARELLGRFVDSLRAGYLVEFASVVQVGELGGGVHLHCVLRLDPPPSAERLHELAGTVGLGSCTFEPVGNIRRVASYATRRMVGDSFKLAQRGRRLRLLTTSRGWKMTRREAQHADDLARRDRACAVCSAYLRDAGREVPTSLVSPPDPEWLDLEALEARALLVVVAALADRASHTATLAAAGPALKRDAAYLARVLDEPPQRLAERLTGGRPWPRPAVVGALIEVASQIGRIEHIYMWEFVRRSECMRGGEDSIPSSYPRLPHVSVPPDFTSQVTNAIDGVTP